MLNNLVHFNDKTRILSRDSQSIELSGASARLLTRLILTPNELVKRDDLLSEVWDRFNLTPSDNNLNKNVSLIRKAFSELGIENSIETLPKQGFVLTLIVKAFNSDLTDVPLSIEESKDSASIAARKVDCRFFLVIATSLLLLSVLCYSIFNSTDDNHGFTYFGKVGLCELYTPSSAKIKSIEEFIHSPAWKKTIHNCESTHKIVYIDDNKLNIEGLKKETFVAVCDVHNFVGRNECENYVFL
ncbi:TPA: winged helix-turn-helix domain-containing protein [Escherichia coli]|nr:winged helix-turn-helix domain-containing protein [Escherichia coli]